MEEWEAREEEKAKKVVRELSSFVNSMSRRPKRSEERRVGKECRL